MIHVFFFQVFSILCIEWRQNSFLGPFDLKKISYLSHKQYQQNRTEPNRNPCSNKFLSKVPFDKSSAGTFLQRLRKQGDL